MNKRHYVGNSDIVKALDGDEGSSTYGEHSITYREVESLGCTPEINVALCANYTQKDLKKRKFCSSVSASWGQRDS